MKEGEFKFENREMTNSEYKKMMRGFNTHSREFGNEPFKQKRISVIISKDGEFIGSASGLTNENKKWFFITDLFVDKKFRKYGLGVEVLKRLENRAKNVGVKQIWTWTAGYEAPGFYKKQGYKIFYEMEKYFDSGHGRVGLIKKI